MSISHPKHPAVEYILENLPDSITQRKAVLEDCRFLLDEDHPLRSRVIRLLDTIYAHEDIAQQQLPGINDKGGAQ